MPDSTRRDFLKASAIAGAAVTLGELTLRSALGADAPPSAPAPVRRRAVLAVVDRQADALGAAHAGRDDPGKFDLQFWLDYFARTHSDAVCLSGGGCVAYYPTKVPFHHRSAWLGDRDVLGDLITGCRKLGMVVIARTDPHATYDDVQAAHPDWIGRHRRRPAAAPLGLARDVGHLRARAVQFRLHDRREEGDHVELPPGRDLHQPLGRLGHVLLPALPRNFRTATGHDLPRTDNPPGPGAPRLHLLAAGAALRALAPLG